MNRFEEMNVTEQQEISGGAILGPFIINQKIAELVAPVVAGAVAGAFMGAMKVLSGK